jgi:mRNA degradation ribonuclease J1/J2
MSEPFSEEDIEDEVLHNWLSHFGMQFHQLHASGHLNREQIKQTTKEIDFKVVFPVQTENAALFWEHEFLGQAFPASATWH